MYLLEPILNTFYRLQMRSVMDFEIGDELPAKPPGDEPLLLYIHIPFCETLCPYCSFHRFPYERDVAAAYFDALGDELRLYRDAGFDFQSLYIGGGTPTIDLDRLGRTLELARDLFSVREISCETNPNHLVGDRLNALADLGIDRLSVGVQTFDDAILERIGRLEKYGSGAQIRDRLAVANERFQTLNVDMIFNIPTQTEATLGRDLDYLTELLPSQVTFYPLMTAPSVLAELRRTVGTVSYRREKLFFRMILERMRPDYQDSTAWCFSRRDGMVDEYVIAYDQYAAAGSGAFGYLDGTIYANTFSLDEYFEKIRAGRFSVARRKRFSRRDAINYYFLMKLFGLTLDKQAFAAKFGRSYERAMFPFPPLLRWTGSVTEDADFVRLTDRGRYYWVAAMREFFIAVDTMRDRCRTNLLEPPAGLR
ncbi:MAG: coproporphyrinogen III oxidase family protein [Candidatus Lernaella stagnicola]|nr:coproporphyrinogen III oxidase family protein [Candidatus Lernaella stagnicola]